MRIHTSARQGGYVTLMSVLLLGTIGAAIAVTLITLGLSIGRGSFLRLQSGQARGMVNACAEEALQQIRNSTAFAGAGSLTFGSSTCSYGVTNLGGQSRRITATSTVGTLVRKLNITTSAITPRIVISGWQEAP